MPSPTSKPNKLYWDTSCFICFLNKSEASRRAICEDVLAHAQAGELEIWISTWVIVEVIRPRKPGNAPFPAWATAAVKAVPDANSPLQELWRRHQNSAPAQKLTPQQILKIQEMFQWPFLKRIYVDEVIASKAVELARDFGLKPADAVHAASAIFKKCAVIQRWDKDFDRVKHLIASEEPKMISRQSTLGFGGHGFGPTPEDFEDEEEQPGHEAVITEAQQLVASTTDISRGGERPSEDQAGTEDGEGAKANSQERSEAE